MFSEKYVSAWKLTASLSTSGIFPRHEMVLESDGSTASDSKRNLKDTYFSARRAPRNKGDEIRARLLWVRQEGEGPAKRAGRDRDTVVAITTLAPCSPGPVPFFARTHGPRLNASRQKFTCEHARTHHA